MKTEFIGELNRRMKARKLLNFTRKLFDHQKPPSKTNFGPYRWQKEFFDAGNSNPERCLLAANRVGKCVPAETLIETDKGPRKIIDLYNSGKPFKVYSYENNQVILTDALAPFEKGEHDCYEILLRDGTSFQAADNHRILLDGSWHFVSDLPQVLLSPRQTIAEHDQLIHGVNVQHWKKKPQDFQVDYHREYRFCGVPLHLSQGTCPTLLLRQVDALQHTSVLCNLDGQAHKHKHNHQHTYDHLSNQDALNPALGLYSALEYLISCSNDLWYGVKRLKSRLLSIVASFFQQLTHVFGFQRTVSSHLIIGASDNPLFINANDVISCNLIGRKKMYDFTVPKTHNYIAHNVVHHNSQTAGMEIAFHATGLYPDWWEGKRFDHPVRIWTGAETSEASRDIIQASLLGDIGQHGTGWIPDECIAEIKYRQAGVPDVVGTILVKYVNGGYSQISLKTYDQGRRKWQGTSQHIVWLDEETPMDIFTEALTRVLDCGGIVLNTFTPLLGNTDVVQHFMQGGDGIYVKNVTWNDAPHLSEDEKKRMEASYPAWEREARVKGVPMLGEGAVFPVSDSELMVQPFEIPRHFALIGGIDFGIDHPTGAVWLAHDRDRDIIYVIDAYRKKDGKYFEHAFAIKQRGDWIRFAWPHDGLKRDGNSGMQIHKYYRQYGVKMLSRSARYDDEKGGSQPIEPIIGDILERMQTGRFKVFNHLQEWFEEKRMYHRKDGKIVDKQDDLMAATRYAVMDLRKARSFIDSQKVRSSSAQRPSRRVGAFAGENNGL